MASSTSFGWGKGGNVTSAGWQVTLRDPMWHVSSGSGVATVRTAIHLLLTYLLTYLLYLTRNQHPAIDNKTLCYRRRAALVSQDLINCCTTVGTICTTNKEQIEVAQSKHKR